MKIPKLFFPIVYWSWNGGPREGRGAEALEKGGQISGGGGAGGGWDSIFENDQSAKVNNIELGVELFRTSTEITGAEWPDVSAMTSPCPTLNVIGAISKAMIEKEELKRMEERPGFDADGNVIKLSKRKKVKRVAQKVVGGVLSRTVGRVGGFLSRRLLGRVPETAIEGSFQEEKPLEENPLLASKVPIVQTEEVAKVEDTLASTIDDQTLIEKEISEQVFGNQETVETEKIDTEMKSDLELIEEAMIAKKEVPSPTA